MRRGAGGMTLIEVVLAVSIVVMLMGALYALYSDALETRASVIAAVEETSGVRNTMRRITEELRAAKVYPFIRIGLKGGPDSMQFITTALPGRAAWAERGLTDNPLPPEHDLHQIGYRLRTYEDDETGEMVIDGLERTCQKIISARESEEGQEIDVALLAGHVKFLNFRYWDGGEYVETWGGESLPGAVVIIMGIEPLPEGTDPAEYPHATWRRVVYIPGATVQAPAPAVRGLGNDTRGGR